MRSNFTPMFEFRPFQLSDVVNDVVNDVVKLRSGLIKSEIGLLNDGVRLQSGVVNGVVNDVVNDVVKPQNNPETGEPLQTPNPLPDRKALDDIVFDAIGLTKEERDEVYRAVCQLVKNRLEKARSV